jgi:glycosyltransferase involved in cell wall biosynthesis
VRVTAGVSVVVPVLNGRRHLRKAVNAILRDAADFPFELLIVDDGSADGSRRIVEAIRRRAGAPIRILDGPGRGAAAALNTGIRQARYPFIAQIDQDVVIERGWLRRLLEPLERDPQIVAVQGRYVVPRTAGFWARASGRDLDLRYAGLTKKTVDHVCTGNTVYRAAALHQIGLFDERLGYGYDNDCSYRLTSAGGVLAFCPEATAAHYWREGAGGYLRQQFGVGYGRLDLIRTHPHRYAGDAVSGALMIAHAPLMLAAAALAAAAIFRPLAGIAALSLLAVLAGERAAAGIRAWRLTRDRAALLFPAAHLLRDAAWAAAIVLWAWRRFTGGSRPCHSMSAQRRIDISEQPGRVLVLIPAYNEAESLPGVVEGLRSGMPAADVLVINDASTDDTERVLASLGVNRLTLSERLGIGGALRAGVRYARRHGYAIVARMDGDGQHRAADLGRLVRIVREGRVDAVAGSRYLTLRHASRPLWQRTLSLALSMATRTVVTDSTSGIWAFGPRALRVLERHHPGGYPEPELRLLLAHRALTVAEVPVPSRERQAGRTSLTARRSVVAFARTALALALATLGTPVISRE